MKTKRHGRRLGAGFLTGLGLLAAWLPAPAHGWGMEGHMISAYIAYQALEPEVKAEVDRLIAVLAEEDPKIGHFVPAATWMDEIRGEGWGAFSHWHYTNRPINGDGLGAVPPEDRHNVLWAVQQAVRSLENERAGDLQKAFMLRILIHTVGDVHQPLHCVARFTQALPGGDQGGNLFLLPEEAGENLHAFWDRAGLLFPGFDPAARLRTDPEEWRRVIPELAEELTTAFPPESLSGAENLDPEAWVRESFTLAVEAVYHGAEENAAPTAEYVARARKVSMRRIVLAGVRLAGLLNRTLGQSSGGGAVEGEALPVP